MDAKRLHSREKKVKRKEILEKKKARDQLIKAASAEIHHLASFFAFRRYERNVYMFYRSEMLMLVGLSVHLESGCGDKLSSPVKQYIQNLLKINMEGPYGSEWPTEEKIKRREMVSLEARYIFVRDSQSGTADDCPEGKDPMIGFVHYRFTLEEEIPILYVYELQLEPRAQGKGLGKFLMQLIELIARKSHMGAVLLTVQKANQLAMKFYLHKMRYIVSSISPSRVDPVTGSASTYEILCRVFDGESKAVFEV